MKYIYSKKLRDFWIIVYQNTKTRRCEIIEQSSCGCEETGKRKKEKE